MELSIRYPEQNGESERLNGYMLDMVRPILIKSNLSLRYWGEALMTCEIIKNCTSNSKNVKTPYERCKKVNPDLKGFQNLYQYATVGYNLKTSLKTKVLNVDS